MFNWFKLLQIYFLALTKRIESFSTLISNQRNPLGVDRYQQILSNLQPWINWSFSQFTIRDNFATISVCLRAGFSRAKERMKTKFSFVKVRRHSMILDVVNVHIVFYRRTLRDAITLFPPTRSSNTCHQFPMHVNNVSLHLLSYD